jgi:hypothetical protein
MLIDKVSFGQQHFRAMINGKQEGEKGKSLYAENGR